MSPISDIGKQMKKFRRQQKITQPALAALLGCTWRTVLNLEKGATQKPTFKVRFAFEKLLRAHAQEKIKI